MINCDDFTAFVLKYLKNYQIGQGLEVLTYKGDRSVAIYRTAPDSYLVVEKGFVQAQYADLALDKLKKLLKTLERREFPRSHKLRTRPVEKF